MAIHRFNSENKLTKTEFKPDPIMNTPIDRTFIEDNYEPLGKPVYIKKETALDAMAGDGGYQEAYLKDELKMLEREQREQR